MTKAYHVSLYKERLECFKYMYLELANAIYDHYQKEADTEEELTVMIDLDSITFKIHSSFDGALQEQCNERILQRKYRLKDFSDEFILQYGSDNFIYGLDTIPEIVETLQEDFGKEEENAMDSTLKILREVDNS